MTLYIVEVEKERSVLNIVESLVNGIPLVIKVGDGMQTIQDFSKLRIEKRGGKYVVEVEVNE